MNRRGFFSYISQRFSFLLLGRFALLSTSGYMVSHITNEGGFQMAAGRKWLGTGFGCHASSSTVTFGTCTTGQNCDADYALGIRVCSEQTCSPSKKCSSPLEGPNCGRVWRCL